MTTFEKVKAICKEKKITFNSLAEKVNMTDVGLRIGLKKESLRMDTVIKICEILNTSTDYLLIDAIQRDIGHDGLNSEDLILKEKSSNPDFNSADNVKKLKQSKMEHENKLGEYVDFLLRYPKHPELVNDPYLNGLDLKIQGLKSKNYLLDLDNRELKLTIRELSLKVKELKSQIKG